MQPPMHDVPGSGANQTSLRDDLRRANQEALRLRSLGDLRGALAVLDTASEQSPPVAEIFSNRGFIAAELGDRDRARTSYARAVELDPYLLAARLGYGAELYAVGDLEGARSQYRLALGLDEENLVAHLAMYELELQLGNRAKALAHQRRALAVRQLFSAIAPNERRRILALCAPGDWFANTPVEYLVDRETTTLHKLFLTTPDKLAALQLPEYDALLNAIGESSENVEMLLLAELVAKMLGRPIINDPLRVLETNRVRCARIASHIAGCNAPETIERSREALQGEDIGRPTIVRPIDSHAGKGARLVGSPAELQSYLNETEGERFFLTPWVDYASPDGYFRKYRLVAVDGEILPYHLAISSNWMVHYYSSEMKAEQWMRDEERRFLEDWRAVFPATAISALERLTESLALEYVGFDCSVDRDGNLLFFEADPAIIVHLTDNRELFGYKYEHVPKIFRAFERLIDRQHARPA
ncbi:MAG: tetratricopeptide repeat protein [Candidatus Baltobacteraceae bacterium]